MVPNLATPYSYRKEKSKATRPTYKRTFCVKLLSKTKKEFHNNLSVNYTPKTTYFGKP